jgi:hypothetical protein
MTNTKRMLAAMTIAAEAQSDALDAGEVVSCEVVWFKKPGGPDEVQIQPRFKSAIELACIRGQLAKA